MSRTMGACAGLLIAGLLAAGATCAASADAPTLATGLRAGYCPPLPQAPELDGRLDDSCWEAAGVLDRFIGISGEDFAEAQTTARVGRDDTNLYVGVYCEEPLMADVVTDAQPGSAYVWMDDCIEIFVDTIGDGKTYAHFMINAAGVRQDELPGERAVRYGWTAAAGQGEDAWSIEVRIPFQDLDVHPPATANSGTVDY